MRCRTGTVRAVVVPALLAALATGLGGCPRRPADPGRTPEAAGEGGTRATDAGAPEGGGEAGADAGRGAMHRLVGILVPHAGYDYSGAVAGWGWRQVQGRPAAAVSGGENGPGSVYPAQVAGTFYPADAAVLRARVEGFLGEASPRSDLAPTPVATVILLAPLHHHPLDGAAVPAEDAYATPLGPVEVDREVRDRLLREAGGVVRLESSWFEGEHALEVELPFLQVALPGARVVPVMVGDPGTDRLEVLGEALAKLLSERSDLLLAVSTDLSHFYPAEEAERHDERSLALLEAMDLETFDREASQRSGLCGSRPVRAALTALRRLAGSRARVERLRYAHSGRVTGETDRVVGYGALALLAPADGENASGEATVYGIEARRELMAIAREAVEAAVRGERYDPPEPAEASLRRDGAAFVTLKKGGELRGCIGHVIASMPLYRCVAEVARSAALEDYRFSAVQPEELEALEYDLSVLTPPERVTDPASVVVGRDGLIMSRGGRRGLLLPQVPVEQGWSREQFLEGTCRKAGLPSGCWRDGETRIERFRAVVWGEDLELRLE